MSNICDNCKTVTTCLEIGCGQGHQPAPPADAIERLQAENAALKQELEEAREDAERYRHMRNNAAFQDRSGPGLYWYLPRFMQGSAAERLDAAIDAEILERKGR